jgi:hypothetical protein
VKKNKAIEEMKAANKITHRHFSSDEWMTIEEGLILLEDGVRCSQSEFWKWRTDNSWDDGYSFF